MGLLRIKSFLGLCAILLFLTYFVIFHVFKERVYQQELISTKTKNKSVAGNTNDQYHMFNNKTFSYVYQKYVSSDLKYPVIMQPNLSKLMNWTDPKYPLTNVTYLIENRELCKSVKNLNVLVVVNTAPDHFERRQVMRETWTNDTYYTDLGTVRVLFLLGRVEEYRVQVAIEKEFQQHKDILQGDFVDKYYNLTHKGVMGLKWLTERCRNAEYILKVDDDFLVNMFIYLHKLQKSQTLQSVNVYCDYKSVPIDRHKKSKWYASENHFRGEKFYKPFCKGKFVSMTNDIIPSLYISASQTPFYPFDDVLLYGYVMHNIPGLKYKTLDEKDMKHYNKGAIRCLLKQKNKCTNFVIDATGRNVMENTWQLILKYFRSK